MFGALAGAIAEVRELDTDACSDSELSATIVALHTLLQQLEAATTCTIAKWDARRGWDADNARSGAAWLAWKCRMEHGTARRRIRLGRALRTLPATEEAWLAGDITANHVNVIARAHTERTAEAMARDEHQLVESARTKWFSTFARFVAYWLQHADPDGADNNAARDYDNRRAHVSPSFGGIVFGDFRLDPLGGAAFLTVLNSIEHEMFETDWATARAEHGADATAAHLRRTPAQRRADALVEMARRAAATPADGRRPAPLFSVLVGYETFAGRICELANGTVVTPGSLLRWLDEAYLERVVFDSPSRVIDVSVERRLVTGALRRAIEVRDRTCFHPTCDPEPDHLQVDHIQPWTADGPTTQTNGRLACGYHNRQRHRKT